MRGSGLERCGKCGAAVADPARHDDFHYRLERALGARREVPLMSRPCEKCNEYDHGLVPCRGYRAGSIQ